MKTSRLPGFYKLTIQERHAKLAEIFELSVGEVETLASQGALSLTTADKMIENAVGIYSLPIGVGLNFLINGKDYLVLHAYETADKYKQKLKVMDIRWDSDGWPTVDPKDLNKYVSEELK